MESFISDIRFGFRMLIKSPVFTIAAVLCLGLGIGANAAIFAFLYGIVISPLPFEDSNRLIMIREYAAERGFNMSVSYPDFIDWRQQQQVFEEILAVGGTSRTLLGEGEPERIQGARISHTMHDVLRVQPIVGRGITEEDDSEGAPGVVLIGHGLWERRFGSDPALVGTAISLSGEPFTVIGIMPRGFTFPETARFWVPLRLNPVNNRGNHSFRAVGRLKQRVSMEQALVEMESIAARLAQEYPGTNGDVGVRLRSLKEDYIGDTREPVWIFYAVVCFILLLACANVANLMLARAAARQQEIAIRSSIGAGRARIARQLITEAVLLSLVGGGLGMFLGRVGRDLVASGIPVDLPFYIRFDMNLPVILSMIGITVLCGILFGLAPAIEATRPNLVRVLQAGSGRTSDGVHKSWFRSFLVALEVGLALVVLVGAGLMMKSFMAMRAVEPGIDPENMLTMRIVVPGAEYDTPEKRIRLFDDAIQRVRSIPGVVSASAVSGLPMSGYNWGNSYYVEGTEPPAEGRWPIANHRIILPGYFQTMGIQLLQGRDFNERDSMEGARQAVIVNQAFVERWWPDENPLGKRISYSSEPDEDNPWMEVVGVVTGVRHYGLDSDISIGIYRPHGQWGNSDMSLAVKTQSDPLSYVEAVRREIWSIDPKLPPYGIRTMKRVIHEGNWEAPLYSWLFAAFSLVALVLAAVGVYGVVSYSVAQRTREFGIRMALGADRSRVIGLVVRQGALLTAFGLIGGLAVALALMHFLQSIMFGINPTDPAVYAVTAGAMAGVAILASYMPARRATRVNPVKALQME